MTMGHRLRSGSARRGLATLSAAALMLSLFAVPALGTHRQNTTVLDAADAVDAALAWSDATFTTASAVVIGRDDVFADNLASGLIQGLGSGSPLLLTDSATLDSDVEAEITRLGATAAHILGGNTAISPAVEAALVAKGLTVHRHAGASRVETAIDIASKHAAAATTALLARSEKAANSTDESQAFADSLAAGAWSAEAGAPVLLTQSNSLHPAVAEYLDNSAVTDVVVVGGTAAISSGVASSLEAMGITVQRVSGPTRFDTAVAIAEERGFNDAGDATETVVVEGQDANSWAGGFAGAAYAALNGAPVVLSNGGSLPAATEAFLANGTGLVCGPLVVSAACTAAAEEMGLAEVPHTNQTFTVTPADTAVKTVSAGAPNENRGSRQFTVNTGSATSVDIALFPQENVTNTAGQITFKDSDGTPNQADWAATQGRVEVTNGVATGDTDGFIDNVAPASGSVTFSVDATAADEVIPVVFVNTTTNATPVLALAADDKPTPNFGIGGRTDWTPVDAQGGTFTVTAPNVTTTNKDANYFVATAASGPDNGNSVTYRYDSNDLFRRNGVPVTLETFEANLSKGDGFNSSIYATDAAASSTFDLNDAAPLAPTALSTSDVTTTSVELDITGVDTGATVKVYGGAAAVDADMTRANAPLIVTTATDADTAETGFQVNITGLAATTRYEFWATQTVDGDESDKFPASDTGTVLNTSTAATPLSTATSFADGGNVGNAANLVDANDIIQIQYDVGVTVANNASITLTDDDGTVASITCGTNASCVVSGASNNILTMTLTGAVSTSNIGDTGGLDVGTTGGDFVTISGASGISNATGNWNLAESGRNAAGRKLVISKDGSETNADLRAISFAATVTNASGTARIRATGGTNEVQTIANNGDRTGGTLTITWNGTTSGTIACNAALAAINTALDAAFGAGNIVAGGTNLGTGGATTLTFQNENAAGDVPLATITNDTCTGGAASPGAPAQTTQGVRPAGWTTSDTTTVYNASTGVSLGSGTVPAFGPLVITMSPNQTAGLNVNIVSKGTTNTTRRETQTLQATVA